MSKCNVSAQSPCPLAALRIRGFAFQTERWVIVDNSVVGMWVLFPSLPRRKTMILCCKQGGISAVSHSRHVCYVTQQTCLQWPICLLRHTADMSAVSPSRHVCCVTQHTCLLCHTLLCHTAGMSAVTHSRHLCCVTLWTCLLCHTADMSAVLGSRHVCCVTQQTSLPCDAADMSAVSPSRHVCCVTQLTPTKSNYLFSGFCGRPSESVNDTGIERLLAQD